jgi:hypothetical protein
MKATIKVFMAGIIGVIMGIIWFVAGLKNDPDSVLSGGLWKGPIAFTVGVVALACISHTAGWAPLRGGIGARRGGLTCSRTP